MTFRIYDSEIDVTGNAVTFPDQKTITNTTFEKPHRYSIDKHFKRSVITRLNYIESELLYLILTD